MVFLIITPPPVAVARDGIFKGGSTVMACEKVRRTKPHYGQLKVVCRDEKKSEKNFHVFASGISIFFRPMWAKVPNLGGENLVPKILCWNFGCMLPYCSVLAPGWGRGVRGCHEHVSDRSGHEKHAQTIGKHSQNVQNIPTASHNRGNCRELRGIAPPLGFIIIITSVEYRLFAVPVLWGWPPCHENEHEAGYTRLWNFEKKAPFLGIRPAARNRLQMVSNVSKPPPNPY